MPQSHRVDPDTEISDIDLDEEEFLVGGKRLTEERAEKMAREGVAEAQRRNLVPGGKSLSGGTTHSPTVQFRVPQDLRDALVERAQAEGTTISKVARRALEQYLSSRTQSR